MVNQQRGYAPLIIIIGLFVILAVAGGSYYMGKSSVKSGMFAPPEDTKNATLNSPVITTLSIPQDIENWKPYKIKALNLEFKLPPVLANKFGNLVEKEVNGERGSQLLITFTNNNGLKITAQSPEFTPFPPPPVTVMQYESGDFGGPGLSVPAVFQGFKYENDTYYGIQTFRQTRELPKEHVTQYHLNGRDILIVKALYGDYGMITHKIFPEDPPKIWGIINDTGNQVYQGLTVEGVLSEELTESVFTQILSTFSSSK